MIDELAVDVLLVCVCAQGRDLVLRGVSQGVVQQVGQDSLEKTRVGEDIRQLRGDVDDDAFTLARGQRQQHPAGDLLQPGRQRLHRQGSGLQS